MVNLYMRLGSFLGGGPRRPPAHGSLNIFEPMAVRVNASMNFRVSHSSMNVILTIITKEMLLLSHPLINVYRPTSGFPKKAVPGTAANCMPKGFEVHSRLFSYKKYFRHSDQLQEAQKVRHHLTL